MLINPAGKPLIVDARLVVAVLTPGRNVSAFSALRVGVGIRLIWSELSVAATVAVSLLTRSALLVTVTVCSSVPTSSVRFIVTGCPRATRMPLASAVLKPGRDAVTL